MGYKKHALVVCFVLASVLGFIKVNRDHNMLIRLSGICFDARFYMFIHVNVMRRGFRGWHRRK